MHRDDPTEHEAYASEAIAQPGADGSDIIVSAFDHISGVLSTDVGAPWPPSLSRQKACLREWAHSLGLLLKVEDLPEEAMRGGMEHDLYRHEDKVIKVTRHGVFGLSPGIDIALVAASDDARRFHLWEATPLDYLERLILHNQLIPGINTLEGVIGDDEDLAIVISQPCFDIVSVSETEIEAWFLELGFRKVTTSGYYRVTDNLGVFDTHDKNLVRFEDTLIPFDIIPCRPAGGFLRFIEDTLAAGHTLQTVRRVSTSSRIPTNTFAE